MRELDRYMLKQALIAFGFFCFILTGVIWLTQAVRLIDTVLSAGESLWRLIEFSGLVLPRVLGMVVPLSGFAAVLFVINKLYTESELVVMMMSGQSPLALARPVLAFALLISTATLLITNILAPAGELRLEVNRQEIQAELANSLIREGTFVHPTEGLSLFIRDAGDGGQMAGLFLHDDRDPNRPVTYTAERAALLRDGDIARLVMSDGVALSYSAENRLLARVRFDEFTYDLSALVRPVATEPTRPSSLSTIQLLYPDERVRGLARYDPGEFTADAHERIVLGVHGALLPLLSLGVMLTGGYQRRGFGKRIMAAVGAGVAVIVAGLGVKTVVIGTPAAWPVSYLPAVLGTALTLFLLWRAGRPRRRPAAVAA
ncbi:LptF/LptG family permease [Halovulum dunhuangense]|uniref:LptF/LptG family permease n=1 Tax=Halovulum dunhuangense TaxID=1505036 RepID=A0A849L3C4_9RHOB|nr:LptF/LptG family permease [Halovulum dunhuangense]NNU80805.1 LptF/LptG family permease [Halovulum dunhuangense]